MVYATKPSASASSTPVTVTVCATFQFTLVKVSEAGETVPSVVSLEASGTVTSPCGWRPSFTVKVAVAPRSLVARPEVGVTTKPAGSCWRTRSRALRPGNLKPGPSVVGHESPRLTPGVAWSGVVRSTPAPRYMNSAPHGRASTAACPSASSGASSQSVAGR